MKSGADFVFLDLEDAVAPDDKLSARENVIEALNDLDWKGTWRNDIGTHKRPGYAIHGSGRRRSDRKGGP